MATTIFFTDTLETGITIGSNVIRKAVIGVRGSGAVTKTDNTTATLTQSVTDDGTNTLYFAVRVAAYASTTGTCSMNVWGLESNAMANAGAGLEGFVYDNTGSVRFTLWTGAIGSTIEYGTVSGVQTGTSAGIARTVNDGDWLVFGPDHIGAGGTKASGFTASFVYSGTTGSASGDSFITVPDTVTAFVAAAQPPYSNPMPPFLAQ